jgi:type I restriction enzyme S subunit
MSEDKVISKGLVPRLRFPEFREADGWKAGVLSQIATIRSGTTPLRSEPRFYQDGTIFWVKTTDLNNSIIFGTQECITPAAKARINPIGSVLIAMYGGFNQIGRTGFLAIAAATNQAISVLNSIEEKIVPIYLLMWLNAKVDFWKNIASSTRKDPNITSADVANFPINYPCINEQQKIAGCLSSLDDLIATQTQKLAALKTHKQGLMQQLFPCEGETAPRLRFPEFRSFDEWTSKQLDNICDVNPSCAALPDSFVYIDLESVEAGVLKEKKIINLSDAPSRAQRLLKIGDVIYQTVRPYQRNNLFFSFEDNQYVASTGYAQLRARENPGFLYQLIHTDNFVKKVINKCTGSNYPAINASDLLAIYIATPQPKEQQKISRCLSCLDELITVQTQKLEALKIHKKGLMQQLFPIIDETPA